MPRILGILESWVRLLRPEFWMVSVFPAWVGWSLATRQFVPDQDTLLDAAWGILGVGPAAGFDPFDWIRRNWRVGLAIVTFGPLLGGSIMVTNDYFDRRADQFNPKKIRSPLVAGTATARRAVALMVGLTALTLVAGFALSPVVGFLLVVGEALSFLYSAPPVRLKARPWADVIVNALGFGALTATAGWFLGGGGDRFPFGGVFIVVASIAAGYLPTVMMDEGPDRKAGLRTTAVVYGRRATWWVGLECLVAANVAIAGLSLMGHYVGPAFVLYQLPFLALELVAYLVWVRAQDPEDIFLGASLTTTGFFGNLGVFLLAYTGLLGTA